jgi:hypothetical protein
MRGSIENHPIQQGVESIHKSQQGDKHADAKQDAYGSHESLLDSGQHQCFGDF